MFDFLKPFLELGSTVVVTLAFIWLLYREEKQKKNGNGGEQAILKQVQMMNENHLHTIENTIRDGNDRVVKAITDNGTSVLEKLSEICGKLSR